MSSPSVSSALGERIVRLVDLAFGIEVDQHLDAGEFAREIGLDLVDHVVGLRATLIAGSTQMWNWTKSCAPLRPGAQIVDAGALRVARGDFEEARRRFSSGHSRSISWSIAWLEARQAPQASQSAMPSPNSGSAPANAEILVEHQRGDHREVEQQVALIMDIVGADRDRAGAADHRALIGDQRQGGDDRATETTIPSSARAVTGAGEQPRRRRARRCRPPRRR